MKIDLFLGLSTDIGWDHLLIAFLTLINAQMSKYFNLFVTRKYYKKFAREIKGSIISSIA